MKTFVKIFSLLFVFSTAVYSQHTLSVEKVIGTHGSIESVTVSIDATINIKSLAMLIKFDENSLTFLDDVSNLNLPNDQTNSFFMHSQEDGVITITWVSATPVEISTNDLFDLEFSFDAGFSEIEIQRCVMKTGPGTTLNLVFSNGSIAENTDHQIMLISPNGGEYLEVVGPAQPITWTSVYIDYIDIDYTTDNGTTYIPIATNVDAADGEFLWTIPNISSNNVYVRVIDYSDATVADSSDAVFTIDSDQSIEMVTPNGGEVLQINGTKVIEWESENVENVKIEYYNGTTWNEIIASTPASSGKYYWVIPSDPTTQGRVRISNVDNLATSDNSNADFTITNAAVPVTIADVVNTYDIYPLPPPMPYTPNFDDILSEVTVTSGWLTAVTSLVIKIGYDPEVLDLKLWDDYENTTSLLYQVGNFIPSFNDSVITLFWSSATPYDLIGELFLIRCKYADGTDVIVDPDVIFSELKYVSATVEDVSGYTIDLDLVDGSVSKTPNPAVKLLHPRGGEVLSINTSPYEIKFGSVNTANVRLDVTTDGGANWILIDGTIDPTDGFYSWDFSTYNSNNCRIFLSSGAPPVPSTASIAKDTSGVFEITNSKELDLLSPDGGEIIQKGRIKNILWHSQNVDEISIDFSADSGNTWQNIIADAPAVSGVFEWSVPDTVSDKCLIAITDASDIGVTDTSSAVFTVEDNMGFVRISRLGNLTLPPFPMTPIQPLSIYISFENLNTITYMSLSFSVDITVFKPDTAYTVAPLNGNGRFISNVQDTTVFKDTVVNMMWTGPAPFDFNGQLIRIDGYYYGGSTDLEFITAQLFDMSGLTMGVNLKDGRLSDAVVGIKEQEEEVPGAFNLAQNYPNPFNPSTTIQFTIPEAGEVTLAVYNVIGQKVATLVDGYKSAGVHEVNWNAGNIANGIYLYRIQVKDFIDTKKLVVLK